MRVGLEHQPAPPSPTTSIGAFPTLTPLSTYPPTTNPHHTATYPPHHPPNLRHHATCQPYLPQTPTLSPTPAHTTHTLPTANASTCQHMPSYPYTYNPRHHKHTAHQHAHSTHHHSNTATAQHHNTYKQYISSD